ncbi:MAG: hypothetical protein AB1523_10745 [Bacillota bacterium]
MTDITLFSAGAYVGTAVVGMLVACMVKFIYMAIHNNGRRA